MKNKQNKKYPISLFLIGFILNLIKNFFLLVPGLFLLFWGIWIEWCFIAGSSLLILDIVFSFFEQIQIRNTTINSDNPNFQEWQDAILSPDWKNNIHDLIDKKTDLNEEDNEISIEEVTISINSIQNISNEGISYYNSQGSVSEINFADAYECWCKKYRVENPSSQYVCDRINIDGERKMIFYGNPRIIVVANKEQEELWFDMKNKMVKLNYYSFDTN